MAKVVFPNLLSLTLRQKICALYAAVLLANIIVWLWAFFALRHHAVLFGSAMLAYSLGLRHAVDADHIAAIDNATRKLMQRDQKPIGVGLFFSLGHSSVVLLVSLIVAASATGVFEHFDGLKSWGSVVGTSASSLFLFFLALTNLVTLSALYRTYQCVKRGKNLLDEDFQNLLNSRGFLTRLFRPLFNFISRSWHLYPIGFLFGLGFDTASEIALFVLSAAEAAQGLPVGAVLIFPALFAAGMTLLDMTDGLLMVGAYGWAFEKPVRKLYYNMTITALSAAIAILIGGVEALGLLGEKMGLEGPFWRFIDLLNSNFGVLGFVIIGLFLVSWAISYYFYRHAQQTNAAA